MTLPAGRVWHAGARPHARRAAHSSGPGAPMKYHPTTFTVRESAPVPLPERVGVVHGCEARREHRFAAAPPLLLVFQIEDQQLFLVWRRRRSSLVITYEFQMVGTPGVPEDDAVEALVVPPG